MTDGKGDGGRRNFLRCTVTAIAALAAPRSRAQDFPKPTLEEAGYRDHAASHTCGECSYFQPPHGCRIVQGPVNEDGTCIYFSS